MYTQLIFQLQINVSPTSDQHYFHADSQHRKKIWSPIFNAAQSCYNVGARRWNNVDTTLIQLLISRLFQHSLNISKSYIKSNRDFSTKKKLINYYNFLTVGHVLHMTTHTEARTFEISKLRNLLEKPWNPPEVTVVVNPSKPKILLLKKQFHFFSLWKKFTCLRVTSHYEKAKRFTTTFSVNFIVTVNLTFQSTSTWLYQPWKDS